MCKEKFKAILLTCHVKDCIHMTSDGCTICNEFGEIELKGRAQCEDWVQAVAKKGITDARD